MADRERILSIDVFRGLAIMLMVIVNYLSGITVIPAWLKHAPDIGLTITDLVAPAFIFAIGLTYGLSYEKRAARDGTKAANYHFIVRFLAIAGIGAFFTGGAAIVSPRDAAGAWGVLQAIGAAGLITLVFIRTPAYVRFLTGAALLFGYQLMLDNFWLPRVLASVQGGLEAAPSWGALMLIATAMADLFRMEEGYKFPFAAASAALLAAGILSSLVFAVSKNRVSFSYILISAGISSLALYIIDLFLRLSKLKLSVFAWWGANPLLLYLIHMILLGVTFVPGSEYWYAAAPLWSAVLQAAAFCAVLCFIAFFLYRKKVYFKL